MASFKEKCVSIGLYFFSPLFGSVTFVPPSRKQITELQTLRPGWTGRRPDGSQAMFNRNGNPIVPTGGEALIGVDDEDLFVTEYRPRKWHPGGVKVVRGEKKQEIFTIGEPVKLSELSGASVTYHGPTSNATFPKKPGKQS